MSRTDLRVAFREDPHSSSETTLSALTISLTSEWHFVKTFFFKIGLETNLE
jgi:hypothetical protein